MWFVVGRASQSASRPGEKHSNAVPGSQFAATKSGYHPALSNSLAGSRYSHRRDPGNTDIVSRAREISISGCVELSSPFDAANSRDFAHRLATGGIQFAVSRA